MSETSERPSDDDVASERTALRIRDIEPIPVANILSEDEFARRFIGRMVITEMSKHAVKLMEELRRIVFCKVCEEHDDKRLITMVTELVVRYEEDPLRAVPMLAHCTCFRCGFEMCVDMPRKPDLRSEEQKLKDQMSRARKEEWDKFNAQKQQLGVAYGAGIGIAQSGIQQALGEAEAAFNLGQRLGLSGAEMKHLRQRIDEMRRIERDERMNRIGNLPHEYCR